MVAKDDPAWSEWDAAMKRVNAAAAALREMSGQAQKTEKTKDAEDELEDALDALEEAADKITGDDDDDD
jgi:hypothetical protein